jgi:hypothetical protein
MITTTPPAIWHYEYLPYTMTCRDGLSAEREIPNFRIFPEDEPENYIAETNEHLPAEVQECHARLIASAPQLLAVTGHNIPAPSERLFSQ